MTSNLTTMATHRDASHPQDDSKNRITLYSAVDTDQFFGEIPTHRHKIDDMFILYGKVLETSDFNGDLENLQSLISYQCDKEELQTLETNTENVNRFSYQYVLTAIADPQVLIQKFFSEPHIALKLSYDPNSDFSITSIQSRLQRGFEVTYYDYSRVKILKGRLSYNEGNFIFRPHTNRRSINIPLRKMAGITINKVTSTLNKKAYAKKQIKLLTKNQKSPNQTTPQTGDQQQKEQLKRMYKDWEYFSFINDMRTYDFHTKDYLAKMDTCLFASNVISKESYCCFPITKSMYLISLAKLKINQEASERYMSKVELFKLAMLKTLMQMGDQARYNRLLPLVTKMADAEYRLFKTAYLNRKVRYKQRRKLTDNFIKKRNRKTMMNTKKFEKIYKEIIPTWNQNKEKKSFIPTMKSLLKLVKFGTQVSNPSASGYIAQSQQSNYLHKK